MGNVENHQTKLQLTQKFFLTSSVLSAFPPLVGPLSLLNNSTNHVSFLSLFPSKCCITSNRPILRCLFYLVPITSTFVSDTYLRLFLLFVASKFAITSGCILQEFAFSCTSARTRGVNRLVPITAPSWGTARSSTTGFSGMEGCQLAGH